MFCLTAFLVGLVDMASDLYVPMLPAIEHAFKVNDSLIGATISVNLVGLGISGLYYGKLSDLIGRRPVIIFGLTIFCIASLACGFSKNITQLLLARLVQGIGGGVAFSVGRAIVLDMYSGPKAAEMFSRLQSVIVVSPAFAPTIGGFIGYIYGWKSIFYILFSISFALLVAIFLWGKETLPQEKRTTENVRSIRKEYLYFFSRPIFLKFAGVQIFTVGWFWSELGFLPQFFVDYYGVEASIVGLYLGALMIAYFLGTAINQYLVHIFNLKTLINIGLGTFFFSVGLLCTAQILGFMSPWLFVFLRLPASIGLGLVFGNAGALAIGHEKDRTGSASAFIGAAELLAGATCIAIVGLFSATTVYPLAIMITVCSIFSVILLREKNDA